MSYKTIVVHLDTSPNAHPRLEIALRLASRFGAHLTGAFAVFSPDPRSLYVVSGTAEYYKQHETMRMERRAALERLFHAELRRAEVQGEWVAIDEPAGLAIQHAGRCADLIVATRSRFDVGNLNLYAMPGQHGGDVRTGYAGVSAVLPAVDG
ncbi:universal stress protein, partial [Klebsiella pneumoniae]|nr:universal stress protein [Klebsiella pneumoniae]